LDHLSNGRFTLGLGVSGPQVVEGWYGQPFGKPLARTREYIDIVRRILRREEPVEFHGEHYQLPYDGPGAWGLGKPLRSITHPLRPDLPILLGAEGPKNVQLATEIADGWLPIFFHVERAGEIYADALAGAGPDFEIACPVTVVVNDDVAAALEVVKWTLAFYIGGMGAANLNFHLNVIGRMGYADAAAVVQQHFLAGDREAAMRAVPDDLADGIALCGPLGRIRERLELWRKTPVRTMLVGGVRDPAHLRALADMVR
jgi:F420-dependent oxidoreductase-like protein